MKLPMLLPLLFLTCAAQADLSAFKDGPLIKGFGRHAPVEQQLKLDTNGVMKVAFDVKDKGKEDKVNRNFNSLARFLNMHVASGFKPENIQLALVVHGEAAYDLLSNKAHENQFVSDNPNHELLNQLIKNNVKIYLCGQSAVYYGVKNKDLHPGAKMALSAMSAHAVLQQQGYTLNPF